MPRQRRPGYAAANVRRRARTVSRIAAVFAPPAERLTGPSGKLAASTASASAFCADHRICCSTRRSSDCSSVGTTSVGRRGPPARGRSRRGPAGRRAPPVVAAIADAATRAAPRSSRPGSGRGSAAPVPGTYGPRLAAERGRDREDRLEARPMPCQPRLRDTSACEIPDAFETPLPCDRPASCAHRAASRVPSPAEELALFVRYRWLIVGIAAEWTKSASTATYRPPTAACAGSIADTDGAPPRTAVGALEPEAFAATDSGATRRTGWRRDP